VPEIFMLGSTLAERSNDGNCVRVEEQYKASLRGIGRSRKEE